MRRTRLNRRSLPPSRTLHTPIRPFLELLEDRTLLAAHGWAGLAGFDQLAVDRAEYDTDRILVRIRESSLGSVSGQLPVGTTLGDPLNLVQGLHEVNLSAGVTVEAALKAYATLPGVVEVRPDYRVHTLLTPNDPQYGSLWGLHNTGQTGGTADADIDAPEAWDATIGSSNVIVAVIDTGVDYTHPDLVDNMWTNSGEIAGNGRDDDGNGYRDDIYGYDFVNDDPDPMDDFGHGTHVAGTIGARGNNRLGVVGVSWNVKIMALKFLGADGGGYISDALKALNYAVQMGARISNNSWGGGPPDDLFREAIRNAGNAGHIFVAAAGNNSSNNDFLPMYPASYNLDNILAVAATDHDDRLAEFSNFGATTVHLGAPGVNILSTVPPDGYLGSPTGYAPLSGTSMATPHVAGVVALVLAQHPDWGVSQVINQVLATVDPISALENQTTTGGRLNAAAAVGRPAPDLTGPRVTLSTPSGGTTGPVSRVRLTFSEAIALTSFTTGDLVSFTGPSGALSLAGASVSEVSGSNGRSFDVTFAEQAEKGSYELILGPQILDRASPANPMDQDRDGNNGEEIEDRYKARFTITDRLIYTSEDTPIVIPELGTTGSVIYVPDDVQISDLDIKVDITHSSVGDLTLTLWSPSFTTVILSEFRGGFGGNDFRGTHFDDEASTPIGSGQAPFAGSYQPETPLAAVDQELAMGYWYLFIDDIADFDGGTLNSWSLEIAPGDGGGGGGGGNRLPNAEDDFAETEEDTPITVNVLANDSDPDGDQLQVQILQSFDGQATLNADQSVTFVPNQDYYGLAGFIYEISDGRGGADQASVYIQVAPVNDAPIARDDVAETTVDAPIVFVTSSWLAGVSLTENDFDPDFDLLTFHAVSNAVNGTVTLDGPDQITFTPAAGFSGTAGFDYTITDGELTATAHVTIGVRNILYISTAASRTLIGSDGSRLAVTRSDIVKVGVEGSGTSPRLAYEMYFRGAAVGLTTTQEDVDAFTFLDDGSILISTSGTFSVPGPTGRPLTGAGEDLLRFVPTSLGANTSGQWEIYFDGSDVGLSGGNENVDSVAVHSDGRILMSTAGNMSVPSATGADTDLLAFTPRRLGSVTTGTWAVYFDGSDVSLSDNSNEDIDGLFVKPPATETGMPTLYLTTRGSFAVPGVTGVGEDAVAFRPTRLGTTTTGTYGPGLAMRGSAIGFRSLNIDGLWMGLAPSSSIGLPPRLPDLPPPPPIPATSSQGAGFDPGALNLLFSERWNRGPWFLPPPPPTSDQEGQPPADNPGGKPTPPPAAVGPGPGLMSRPRSSGQGAFAADGRFLGWSDEDNSLGGR